jgi:hypothetical protein
LFRGAAFVVIRCDMQREGGWSPAIHRGAMMPPAAEVAADPLASAGPQARSVDRLGGGM